MSYRTDMIEEILTSEEGQTILEYLSPIYGRSFAGLWLLQVIGMQLDKASQWTAELFLQVTPETATWTIEFWEKEYGITPNPNLSLERRRQHIMTKMLERSAFTPYRIEQLVKTGFDVDCLVRENLDGTDFSANKFMVVVRKSVTNEVREGIRELITNMKPAHLIFDVTVAQLMQASCDVKAGIATSVKDKSYIRVVQ